MSRAFDSPSDKLSCTSGYDPREEAAQRPAGKSSPEPDACAFGVPRAQCHLQCGYRCTRARRERQDGRGMIPSLQQLAEISALGQEQERVPLRSHWTGDCHAGCGTDACCGDCS